MFSGIEYYNAERNKNHERGKKLKLQYQLINNSNSNILGQEFYTKKFQKLFNKYSVTFSIFSFFLNFSKSFISHIFVHNLLSVKEKLMR